MAYNRSLHDVLGMKSERSTLKSVFITPEFFEGSLVIEVEAYDDTGYQAINSTPSRFDEFYDYLNRTIISNFDKINNKTDRIRVNIHGNEHFQYIITRNNQVF